MDEVSTVGPVAKPSRPFIIVAASDALALIVESAWPMAAAAAASSIFGITGISIGAGAGVAAATGFAGRDRGSHPEGVLPETS